MEKELLYAGSWPLRRLLRGERKEAFSRLCLFFLSIYLIGAVFCMIDGSLIIREAAPAKKSLGYLQDFGTFFYLFSVLVSLFLFKVISEKFIAAFNGKWGEFSRSDGIPGAINFKDDYEKDYRRFLQKWTDIITLKHPSKKLYAILQLSILVIFLATSIIMPILSRMGSGNWNFTFYRYPFGFIANQIKDFIIYVILVPPALWRITLVALATIRICKKLEREERFLITPLSPDKAGGLRPIGEIALLLFYLIIAQFINLFPTSLILGFPVSHQLMYPLLLCFAVFLFFFPLMSAHNSMKLAKENELKKISHIFRSYYSKYRDVTSRESCQLESESVIHNLIAVKELYKEAEKMPVWPYDFGTLARFASIFMIPLILFIIQLFANADSILYNLDKLKLIGNIKTFFGL